MEQLVIVWTTSNKEVFENVIAMYAGNSLKKKWWTEVSLIIWGPSAKIASQDTQVQTEIFELLHTGVKVMACKECSDNYGVTEKLEKMGVEVKYMGAPLTEYLKNNIKVLTF